jgi:hypothetical protein
VADILDGTDRKALVLVLLVLLVQNESCYLMIEAA